MPEQAPYPAEPWWQQAQTKRTVGQMTGEEFNDWFRGHPEGGKILYGKEYKLDNPVEKYPGGFLIHKQHPELKNIEDNVDLYEMPHEGLGKDFYMAKPKPKAPLVS